MYSKEMIHGAYKTAIKEKQSHGFFYPRRYKKIFEYCMDIGLDYDHRDYYNIPALCYDEEHSVEGFLTSVYFTRNGLYYFLYDPEYNLHLFSETYGNLRYKDKWSIPFGINRNGNVVFWLGDLSYMDERSLQILKPHNIESDHQLIDSEFYAAQLCCIWSDPNSELKVCFQRMSLYEHIKDKHGIELFHLEDEVKNQMDRFQKQLVINESTIESSINLLHKVLVEGVNITELRKLYELYVDKTTKGYMDWKSIKLYQGILEGSISDDALKEIISPMYLLNDFRQYFDHLLSNQKKESIKANILNSLQMESFEQINEIYDLILKRLAIFYEYLSIAVEKKETVNE